MKITDYIKETRGELKQVTWPTRRQAIAYSVIIIVFSLATALFLGLFDFLFSKLITIIIK